MLVVTQEGRSDGKTQSHCTSDLTWKALGADSEDLEIRQSQIS